MSIKQHAERILMAWNRADRVQFESELDDALYLCQHTSPTSTFHAEAQEVLESVVKQLRKCPSARGISDRKVVNQGMSASFALLAHLCHRAA